MSRYHLRSLQLGDWRRGDRSMKHVMGDVGIMMSAVGVGLIVGTAAMYLIGGVVATVLWGCGRIIGWLPWC